MSTFFNTYKVIIFGCLSAIILALKELVGTGAADTKVLVFAAAIAALSFLANNLRGQVATILGLVLTSLATYMTAEASGTVSWAQIILSLLAAIMAVFIPPAKSVGYERTQVIEQAKKQGEAIVSSSASV